MSNEMTRSLQAKENSMRIFRFALSLLIVGALATAALAQQRGEVLIKNATIMTASHGTIENGSILIRDGKIVAVGKDVTAGPNAKVIDATGMYVTPGFVDARTRRVQLPVALPRLHDFGLQGVLRRRNVEKIVVRVAELLGRDSRVQSQALRGCRRRGEQQQRGERAAPGARPHRFSLSITSIFFARMLVGASGISGRIAKAPFSMTKWTEFSGDGRVFA